MNGVASETLVGGLGTYVEPCCESDLEDVEYLDIQIEEVEDLIAFFLTIE